MYDLIIIGAGPAGLAASIYASRYKLKHIVIGKEIGGLVNEAHEIGNYPGFPSISGVELMQKFVEHARSLGAEIISDEVVHIHKLDEGFEVETKSGDKYEAKTLIIATGLERRRLNIPGEKEFVGRGVSYCATCDAFFFKDKTVCVIGGSDSAAMAALALAQFAKKVYIIYRRSELRCEPVWKEKIEKNEKIEVIYNTNVIEIMGNERVEAIKLDNPYQGSDTLEVDGVFIEIGFTPGTSLVSEIGVELDESGYIKINPDCSTNVEGVFAAGDITNGSAGLRQIVTAVAEGAIAVYSAFRYLKGKK